MLFSPIQTDQGTLAWPGAVNEKNKSYQLDRAGQGMAEEEGVKPKYEV